MPDYQKAKIYKLVNDVDESIYVGSTCHKLKDRLSGHKCDAKRYSTYKVYEHLNKIGWEHVTIELIEKYPCETKRELWLRERYWTKDLKADLNTMRSIVTLEEAKQEKKEYNRKYKKEHQKQINKWNRKWYKENHEKAREYMNSYYDKNREKCIAYVKAYRERKKKTESADE